MIDGERGQAIFDQVVAHRMDAIVDGETITASMIGACLADALRKGLSPRDVAMKLRDGLPDDEEWFGTDGVRDQIEEALDEYDGLAA